MTLFPLLTYSHVLPNYIFMKETKTRTHSNRHQAAMRFHMPWGTVAALCDITEGLFSPDFELFNHEIRLYFPRVIAGHFNLLNNSMSYLE